MDQCHVNPGHCPLPLKRSVHFKPLFGAYIFRTMSRISLHRLPRAVLIMAAVILPLAPAAREELTMVFTNAASYPDDEVWITLQRGQPPSSDVRQPENRPTVTFGGSSFNWQIRTNGPDVDNLYSDPVQLSAIKDGGGLVWVTNAPATVV